MGTFLRAGEVSLNRISWELSRSSAICPRRSRMSWARSAILVSGMYLLLDIFTGGVIALDSNNGADDGSVQEHLPLLSQDHQGILDECAFRENLPASIIPVVVLAVLGGVVLELAHRVLTKGRDNQWGCALEQDGWPVVRGVFCDGIPPYNIDGLDPVAGHGAVKGVDRAGALKEPPASFVGIYTVCYDLHNVRLLARLIARHSPAMWTNSGTDLGRPRGRSSSLSEYSARTSSMVRPCWRASCLYQMALGISASPFHAIGSVVHAFALPSR